MTLHDSLRINRVVVNGRWTGRPSRSGCWVHWRRSTPWLTTSYRVWSGGRRRRTLSASLLGLRSMFRLHPFVLAAVVALVGGCTRATFGFRPSLTSQVPDSTVVRVRAQNGQPSVTGRALHWQDGRPRIITSAGDTVAVPQAAALEVRLKEKRSHATLGGVFGLGVGMGIALARCPATNRCAPDLTPALAAGIGALIGSRFTAAEWVRVRSDIR